METSELTTLSVEQCKDVLRTVGKMFCVKPEWISTKLLSSDDKEDMKNGELPIESLIAHVKVWVEHGMLDYVSPKFDVYEVFERRL